jgi:hypothetical protein
LTVSDVKLGVGEVRSLDLHLQPAGLKESLTVSAEFESAVQTNTASIAATIGEEPVNNLPINGRMISNLYLLAPGAQLSGSGSFGDVRFFGRSNEQNVIRYDGIQAGTIIDSNPADLTVCRKVSRTSRNFTSKPAPTRRNSAGGPAAR